MSLRGRVQNAVPLGSPSSLFPWIPQPPLASSPDPTMLKQHALKQKSLTPKGAKVNTAKAEISKAECAEAKFAKAEIANGTIAEDKSC